MIWGLGLAGLDFRVCCHSNQFGAGFERCGGLEESEISSILFVYYGTQYRVRLYPPFGV